MIGRAEDDKPPQLEGYLCIKSISFDTKKYIIQGLSIDWKAVLFQLLVNVKSKSMLGKLTLAEYSVNIGKIGLEDGREKAIKPFKHKSQKLGSKDIPDLRFKLTYHKLGSFAIADKIRRISRITESIITDHPGFKAHMNGSGLDQVDGGDESGEDSDVENGDTAKSEISENGEKAADRRLYRRTSSIIEEPISCGK